LVGELSLVDDQAGVGLAVLDELRDLVELDQDVIEIAAALAGGFAFAQGELQGEECGGEQAWDRDRLALELRQLDRAGW